MLMGIEPPSQKVAKNLSSESQAVFEQGLFYTDSAHDAIENFCQQKLLPPSSFMGPLDSLRVIIFIYIDMCSHVFVAR